MRRIIHDKLRIALCGELFKLFCKDRLLFLRQKGIKRNKDFPFGERQRFCLLLILLLRIGLLSCQRRIGILIQIDNNPYRFIRKDGMQIRNGRNLNVEPFGEDIRRLFRKAFFDGWCGRCSR